LDVELIMDNIANQCKFPSTQGVDSEAGWGGQFSLSRREVKNS